MGVARDFDRVCDFKGPGDVVFAARDPLDGGSGGTRNTWAPAIYWDSRKGEWLLIWWSMIEGKMEENRLWSARTRDFVSLSEPRIWFDPGHMVIDATLIRSRGKWVMVFKMSGRSL